MLLLTALWLIGSQLSAPARNTIGEAPAALHAESIVIQTDAGDAVRGWFSAGRAGQGGVLLLHGVRGNRREMLGRALWLHEGGYAVMLIDLPAHGESGGEQITYGLNEGAAVRAALAELRRRAPGERVGVIGVSLGAAALVLGHPQPAPDAAVLESMFPTIEDAVADRLALHVGEWARPAAPALLLQLPLRLHVEPSQLRPIEHIAALHCPLLLIAGDQDQHTRLVESQKLFATAVEPKQLWIVPGAAHINLHDFDTAGYQAGVGAFLAAHLHRASITPSGAASAPSR
ncbi:alpha/beta hydrolase [Paucibacter sp. R3-3]|uniref:Alpha/beta hydrolase n=1 Tax=Roseateles agri TaxID=3098619 RepID=A0ABU5DP76_9BURK|nr:alpha/beta hydrolase [Paucibacter sp. R3-3]MDY0747465.1 alpha/beta hydrolase [Paucibacter sp. R3-3]